MKVRNTLSDSRSYQKREWLIPLSILSASHVILVVTKTELSSCFYYFHPPAHQFVGPFFDVHALGICNVFSPKTLFSLRLRRLSWWRPGIFDRQGRANVGTSRSLRQSIGCQNQSWELRYEIYQLYLERICDSTSFFYTYYCYTRRNCICSIREICRLGMEDRVL